MLLRREVEEKGVRLRSRDEELAMQSKGMGGGRQSYEKQMEMIQEEQTTSRSTIHR